MRLTIDSRIRRIVVLGFLVALATTGTARASVDYALAPIMAGDKLEAVEVSITFRGDDDGRTLLELPNDFAGGTQRWRFLNNFRALGATIEHDGPARLVLHSGPGSPITVSYKVATAYDADPNADQEVYDGPAIRPTWFYALGEFLFAKPAGRGSDQANFVWNDWPAAWGHASDADHALLGHPVTVDEMLESTLLAGADVVVIARPITGGTLRLVARGEWRFSADEFSDRLSRLLSLQRSFWSDVNGPFTVTLIPFPLEEGRSAAGGTGRSDGFGLWATPDVREENMLFVMAHEHIHTWIPRRIGTRPEPEASAYWLSEGFTDFYAQRTLLRTGIWTPEQFVADLNRVLLDYASSPVRDYPNSRIVAEFWTDRRLLDLPYRRGAVFAYLVDRELRRTSRNSANLDTVMFAMRNNWVAAPESVKPELIASFLAATAQAGLALRTAIANHIEGGQPILLPADLFPDCVRITTETIPEFNPGFDRDASARTGFITGVELAGPAYAAGLRDGMRRLSRIGGLEGDSRVPFTYLVEDKGEERSITYKPEGKAQLIVQTAVLLPMTTSMQVEACARSMSGILED